MTMNRDADEIASYMREAAGRERDEIVAWIRRSAKGMENCAGNLPLDIAIWIAESIENGEHKCEEDEP